MEIRQYFFYNVYNGIKLRHRIIYFFLQCIVEKALVFWVRFLKWIYPFLGSMNPKITLLAVGLCVRVYVNTIQNLSTETHKNNLDVCVTYPGNCCRFISCYFMQILNKFNLKNTIR